MEVLTHCMECFKELGHPSFEPINVPYYESLIAEVECSRGHKSYLQLQAQKFEVLLHSAADAYLAGFTLECCGSAAAALERCYEFGLKVLLHHKNVKKEIFDQMFKDMARQSERQIGAFMTAYVMEFGKVFSPDQKIAKFRNDVIHKGLIPTPPEAESFLSQSYSEIFRIIAELETKCRNSIQAVVMLDMTEKAKKYPSDANFASSSGNLIFSLALYPRKPDFSEAMNAYIETKKMLKDSIPELQKLNRAIMSRYGDSKPA